MVLVEGLMETSVEGGQVCYDREVLPCSPEVISADEGHRQVLLLVLAAQAGSTLATDVTPKVGVIPV
jgi:hypothetical protein